MTETTTEDAGRRCQGCYDSFSGWWCDNCDRWPCVCVDDKDADLIGDDES